IHARCHDVDDMPRLALKLVAPRAGDACRPMRDQRRADAALVRPMVVFTERRVAQVRPAAPIGGVSVRSAAHHTETLTDRPTVARLLRLAVMLLIIVAHGRQG